MDSIHTAKGNWLGAAVLLERLANVRTAGPDRWRATCPAHGTGRNQALSIAAKGGKVLIFCFAGCSADAVLSALGLEWRDLYAGTTRPWERPGYYRPASAPIGVRSSLHLEEDRPPSPEAELRDRWSRWWDSATPSHPLLQRYLRARGLTLEPPPTLRLAAWKSGPVMLARVVGPDGSLAGLHLTLLSSDASSRLNKKLAKGSRVAGAAIRLRPVEPDKPLALTEGIETALAVHEATGWPTWACVSAVGLERVVLPPEAREIVVAADHDTAGLEAAHKLARRLLDEGLRVRLAVPPEAGQDWLDLVAKGVA